MSSTSWRPGRPEFTKAQKRTILQRDPLCRACCNNPSTIADHIRPTAEGGTNTVDNGQGLCGGCHDRKTEQERLRGLARRPTRRRQAESHPGLLG